MNAKHLFYFTTVLRDRATGRVLLWHRSDGPFCCAIRKLWPDATPANTYTDVWVTRRDAGHSERFVPGAVQVHPNPLIDQRKNGGGHA